MRDLRSTNIVSDQTQVLLAACDTHTLMCMFFCFGCALPEGCAIEGLNREEGDQEEMHHSHSVPTKNGWLRNQQTWNRTAHVQHDRMYSMTGMYTYTMTGNVGDCHMCTE